MLIHRLQDAQKWVLISLVPRPPYFTFCLRSQYTGAEDQQKKIRKAWEHSSVNDVRWTWGGCRGWGAQLPKQRTGPSVWALYHTFRLQTLAWWKLLVLSGKKLAFKFSTYIFEYRPLPPYVHLASTHVMNASRPSLFFAGIPLPCIIENANRRPKRDRPGTEARSWLYLYSQFTSGVHF